MLTDSYVDMQRALVGQATKGDINAIKFAYELTGRWNPNAGQIMETREVIGAVVEIIQKYVTEPEQLTKIATEMQFLATRAGLNVGGQALELESIEGEVIGYDN
jgi:hypothetical protein